MRELQAAQLAAAFIFRAGRAVGVVRLVKLLYLAEREAMERFGTPIVFDDVYAMREGMALSRTFDLMKRESGTPTTGEWARLIAPPSHRGIDVCQGVGEQVLEGLGDDALEVVNHVWARYGSRSRDELVHEVHHELPEWRTYWGDPSRRSAAVPVPYDVLLQIIRGPDGDAPRDTEARQHVAVELFRQHALSLGRAARYAGVPIAQFMADVSRAGVPVITGTAESVRDDASAIGAWREGS